MAARRPSSRLLPAADELRRAFAAPDPVAGAATSDPVAEAYERGLREGRERGAREAEEAAEHEAESLREQIAGSLRRLGELEEELERRYRGLMIELALEAATRIVRARVEADDPLAARALEQAIDALPPGDVLRARVHPDDLDSIGRQLADAIERRHVELIADSAIGRGGCVVESPSGIIDARLDTAIDCVRSAAEGRAEAS